METAKPAVGEKAPGFELPSAAGEAVRLEQFYGKPLLLTFVRSSG
jgi:peroxiredoxin